MKRIALSVLICLAIASVSSAQQSPADAPASKQDVERYLDTMHTRDLMGSMMDVMKKQMHQMAHEMVKKQSGLPSDFEPRMDKMMDDMLSDFPVDEMVQAMVPVYQKHFTKGDVDALVAFYLTPTGQKVLRELPAITGEAMQASSGIVQKMMAKAMQRVQDEIAQAQKAEDASSSKKPQQN